MELKFVAGVTPIVRDLDASLTFYRDTLGVPVANSEDHPEYFATDDMPGLKHIGLWRLERRGGGVLRHEAVAERRSRSRKRPSSSMSTTSRPAAQEMVAAGYTLVHDAAHRTVGSASGAGDEPRRSPHRPHVHPLDARLTMRR